MLAKALANPKRIEIIDLLCQSEKSVEDIAEQAGLGLKNASAQLRELKAARMVEFRKDGKYVYYRLADLEVAKFFSQLRAFGHDRVSEIQKIARDAFDGHEALEHMDRKTLLARAKRGEIVLIDVRPTDEFESAHLPFAISIPVSEISKHLKSLPKKKMVVAYCRGPYCFFAKDAVETLRKHGFKAFNLKDSITDWSGRGLPIVQPGLA